MERPIAFNLLRKDELIYEVRIRDEKPASTVEELRVQIRELNKLIGTDDIVETNIDPESELQTIKAKLPEISEVLDKYPSSFKKFNRVKALSFHLYHRLSRITPPTNLSSDYAAIDQQLSGYLSRIDSVNASFHQSFTSAEETPKVTSDLQPKELIISCKKETVKTLGIKFDGTGCVKAFIERLEELCEARDISEATLHASAPDLFSDGALLWYRGIKASVDSWSDLKKQLLTAFAPPDYDMRLISEITNRTQGPTELSCIYIAVMENLYNRLSYKVPERDRLARIKFNMRPDYTMGLSIMTINTLDDLKERCRQLELGFHSRAQFHEPPKPTSSFVAADLAYQPPKGSQRVEAVKADSGSSFCVRCRIKGHLLSQCKSTEIVCFRCGKKGVRAPSCPTCSKKQKEAKSCPTCESKN